MGLDVLNDHFTDPINVTESDVAAATRVVLRRCEDAEMVLSMLGLMVSEAK